MSDSQNSRRGKIVTQAEGYLELDMPRHALDALDRLEKTSRENLEKLEVHALYLRGEALRSLGQFEEAIEPLGEAARRGDDNIHVHLAIGWCYKRMGSIRLAIDALQQAMAIRADDPLIHYNLACYWSLAGEKRQTLVYLSQALEMDEKYRELVEDESDFDSLRSDPDFQDLAGVIV